MSPRRPLARWLALAALLLLASTLVGAPVAAQHRHDAIGLYDSDCPLAAVAVTDRQTGISPVTPSARPVEVSRLLVASLPGSPALPAVSGPRLRAPPAR